MMNRLRKLRCWWRIRNALASLIPARHNNPESNQGAWRIYKAASGETTGDWTNPVAAENTAASSYDAPRNRFFVPRIEIANTGGSGTTWSDTFNLYITHGGTTDQLGSSTWVSQGNASTSALTDSNNRLTTNVGGTSFAQGYVHRSDGAWTPGTSDFSSAIANGTHEEHAWVLEFVSPTSLGNTVTFDIRTTGGSSSELQVTSYGDISITVATNSGQWDLTGWRWRNDDGDDTTATYAAAENVALNKPTQTDFRIQLGVFNASSVTWSYPNYTLKIQWRINGGSWVDVPASTGTTSGYYQSSNMSSGHIVGVYGLTRPHAYMQGNAPVGIIVNDLDASVQGGGHSLTDHKVYEWPVRLRTDDLAGDTVEFRVVETQHGSINDNATNVLNGYPSIVVDDGIRSAAGTITCTGSLRGSAYPGWKTPTNVSTVSSQSSVTHYIKGVGGTDLEINAGDLLIIVARTDDDASWNAGAATPSGWTLADGQELLDNSVYGYAVVWYKIATGSENAVAFTFGQTLTNWQAVSIVVPPPKNGWKSSPFDGSQTDSTANTADETNYSTASLTPTEADDFILEAITWRGGSMLGDADTYDQQIYSTGITAGIKVWMRQLESTASVSAGFTTITGGGDLCQVIIAFAAEQGGGTVTAAGTILMTGAVDGIGSNIRLLGAGTITMTNDVAATSGASLAAGTSTLTGDLAAVGSGMVYAAGTIALSGDLAASAKSLAAGTILVTASKQVSGGTHFASATITCSSDVTATSGALRASGTISLPCDVAAAPGLLLAFAAGSIDLAGDLAAYGRHGGITGTVTLPGDLAAIGVALGGIVNAAGTILLTGDQAGVGTSLAYGTILVTASKTVSGGTHFASATISMAGDCAATSGASLAAGTSTLSGNLVAAPGTTFVYAAGTISMTGDGAAVGASLAAGTVLMTGDLVADARQLGAGTVTYIGQLIAGGGASLGAGTIALAGDLAAVGDNIVKTPSGTITISATLGGIGVNVGSSYATLVPSSLASDANSNIAAGTYTNIDETVDAADGTTLDSVTNQWTGSGTASAFVFNLTDVPSDFASAKTAYIRVRARVTGTATAPQDENSVLGEVIGTNAPTSNVGYNEGDVGAGFINRAATSQSVSSASAANINGWQVRFYQTAFAQLGGANNLNFEIDAVEVVLEYQALTLAAGTITLSGALDAIGSGKVYAAGTITIAGDLASDGKSLAAGTANLTGDLVAKGTSLAAGTVLLTGDLAAAATAKIYAAGTISLSGDLAGRGTTLAYGTILVTASKQVSGGTHFASATITCTGTLSGVGTSLAAGTVILPGDLAAIGENALSLVNAAGTVTLTATLAGAGTSLAAGTITLSGDLAGATGISTAAGTVTLTGTLAAGGGTHFAAGSSTLAGALAAFGVAYGGAPAGTITMTGELDAVGSVVVEPADGTIAITGEVAASGTHLASGTITLIGQGDAVGGQILYGAGTIGISATLTATGFDLTTVIGAEATISLAGDLYGKLRKRCHGLDNVGTISISGSLSAIGNDGGKVLAAATIRMAGSLTAPAPTWFAIEIAGGAGSLFMSGNHDGGNNVSVLQDIGAFTGLNLTGYMIWNVSDEALTKDPIISNTDDTVTATLTGGVQNDWDTGEAYQIFTPDTVAVSKRLAYGTINMSGAILEADLRKVSCINPTGTITILGAVLSAGYTDPNMKFALGTIDILGSLSIYGPQPAYGTITMTSDLKARPQNTLIGELAATSRRARMSGVGLVGPGTINGRKLYTLRTAYGSVTIYNNGAGGFYTIGLAEVVKEAFGNLLIASTLNASGTGDSLKLRSGSIVLPGDMAAKGRHTGVAGTVGITGDLSAGGGKHRASGSIIMAGDLAANGFVDEVYSLHGQLLSDAAFAPGTAEVRIRVGTDGNFYWWTHNEEGTNQLWVQLFASSDWIRPTTFAASKYVRAILVTGSTPYLGTLNTWQQTDVDRDWGLKVVAGFAGGEKDCRLRIDLGDDGATVIEQAFFDLDVQLA